MKAKLLLIPLVIAGISSCSTAYKTAQTPDDVYFSPPPPHVDYVSSHHDENKVIYNDGPVTSPTSTTTEVPVIIHSRRWRRYHGYDYGNYGYYPYGSKVYGAGRTTVTPANPSKPRKFTLGGYKSPATTTTTPSVLGTKIPTEQPSTSAPVRTFRTTPTTNSGTGVGNLIRKVFSSSGSSDNSSPSRSSESRNSSSDNSSSSKSSRSSSSSSAPVRTFHK